MKINWSTIPTSPGVYLWKGINDQVIYVGKAKNLKNRMKQYFKDNLSPKNKLLLINIVDFDFQVCSSEIDALVLEQNLINEYEPKFNIKIKASTTYPYIELRTGTSISLVISKKLKFNRNSKYFGPYPNGYSARKIINILSSVLPLDKCLSPNSGKPCLNYIMLRCIGKCIGIDYTN
ncbi:MAG: GIY-YIG nuclease family protein, partial [Mycoplasmataceae bacterium]|nr:GIY-YIG nuclease family protein [Mycoplasmataceae bacterium]